MNDYFRKDKMLLLGHKGRSLQQCFKCPSWADNEVA